MKYKRKVRSIVLWLIAVVITIVAAGYQQGTGPTYPIEGSVNFAGVNIEFSFPRSHGGEGGALVEVPVGALNMDSRGNVEGVLCYKRHKVDEAWNRIPMELEEDKLTAVLPHQPPAGKLDFRVELIMNGEKVTMPGQSPAVIRFKGAVPLVVLIPHIIFMFLSMLMGTRAGVEAFSRSGKPISFAVWSAVFMLLGGLIFGPIVQKYAFGAFWTGFPYGIDLTDNKTLIAMIGWVVALMVARRRPDLERVAVISAVILMWAIFLIPHSTLGSELDYSKMEQNNKAGIVSD
jgi:hypothetical protein